MRTHPALRVRARAAARAHLLAHGARLLVHLPVGLRLDLLRARRLDLVVEEQVAHLAQLHTRAQRAAPRAQPSCAAEHTRTETQTRGPRRALSHFEPRGGTAALQRDGAARAVWAPRARAREARLASACRFLTASSDRDFISSCSASPRPFSSSWCSLSRDSIPFSRGVRALHAQERASGRVRGGAREGRST
eukprot:881162-Prymnesium_polylepis.1